MENGIVKNRIAEFKEIFSKGMNCLAEACRIYVEDIEANPGSKQEYRRQFPQIGPTYWTRFEFIGSKKMIPQLLYLDSPMIMKLIGEFSLEEQEKIQKNGIDVLTVDGTTLKVAVKNLTPEQARQVFTKTGVRDVPAQRAYIESLRTCEQIEKQRSFLKSDPYIIKKDYVEILKPGRISRDEIMKIATEMMK